MRLRVKKGTSSSSYSDLFCITTIINRIFVAMWNLHSCVRLNLQVCRSEGRKLAKRWKRNDCSNIIVGCNLCVGSPKLYMSHISSAALCRGDSFPVSGCLWWCKYLLLPCCFLIWSGIRWRSGINCSGQIKRTGTSLPLGARPGFTFSLLVLYQDLTFLWIKESVAQMCFYIILVMIHFTLKYPQY